MKADDEMKPRLSDMPVDARETLAEAVLREQAIRDPAYVVQRLRHMVEQLATEGVFEGMSEEEVQALLREAVQDLNVSPERGSN